MKFTRQIEHESMPSKKPAVLFITPTTPLLSGKGGSMRAGMHILALSGMFTVHVLVLNRFGVSLAEKPEPDLMAKMATFDAVTVLADQRGRIDAAKSNLDVLAGFVSRPLSTLAFSDADSAAILEILGNRKFDLIFFGRLATALLMENRMFRDWAGDAPRILDLDDIESDAAFREARTLGTRNGRIAYFNDLLDAFKLRYFERRLLPHFDLALVCSTTDQATMTARHPETRFGLLPNGFQVPPRPVERQEPAVLTLLFVGSLQYPPNADGVIFFCTQVLPQLRERLSVPFHLVIVGREPTRAVRDLGALPEVTVTGTVPDVEIYYHSSTMAIVPIRFGGGTRIKILEALALGCPVISTTLGAEGIEVTDGKNILLADTAAAMADACVRLAEDGALRARLSRKGWDMVNVNYSVKAITARMAACVHAIYGKNTVS